MKTLETKTNAIIKAMSNDELTEAIGRLNRTIKAKSWDKETLTGMSKALDKLTNEAKVRNI